MHAKMQLVLVLLIAKMEGKEETTAEIRLLVFFTCIVMLGKSWCNANNTLTSAIQRPWKLGVLAACRKFKAIFGVIVLVGMMSP